ncbi:MAG: hypothetical protein ACP5U1_10730 [Desulfomonilaceae bacterium]
MNHLFDIELREIHYCSYDRFSNAGIDGHYFLQDLWAAKKVLAIVSEREAYNHADVGSRLDGFVAHLLPYCNVTYVDIRPLPIMVEVGRKKWTPIIYAAFCCS